MKRSKPVQVSRTATNPDNIVVTRLPHPDCLDSCHLPVTTMLTTMLTTNVQDCHKMSKLYLVHLRPLGLHGILLVVLSIQVAVVPSCLTTWDILGTSHYLTPPCQSQVRVVPSFHGTYRDIPGTSPYLTLVFPLEIANQVVQRCKLP